MPWVLSVGMAFCVALHSVGFPGGVITPSGLVWVLRLAFSFLVAPPMSWVFSASTAFSNALHFVAVPGGVIAPLVFGWVLWSAPSSLVVGHALGPLGLEGPLHRPLLRGCSGGHHRPLRFVLGAWVGIPVVS